MFKTERSGGGGSSLQQVEVRGQPGLQNKTMSQKTKRNKEYGCGSVAEACLTSTKVWVWERGRGGTKEGSAARETEAALSLTLGEVNLQLLSVTSTRVRVQDSCLGLP